MKGLLVSLLVALLFGCATQYDKNEQAYVLHQEGIEAFEDDQIYRAQELFEEAISYVSYDQQLPVGTKSEYGDVSCVKRCTFSRDISSNYVRYAPNDYLKKIDEKIYQRQRKIDLADKYNNPPKLEILMRLDDTDGDRALSADESGFLSVLITNIGTGDAERVALSLSSDLSSLHFPTRSQVIDQLPAGESQRLSFPISNSLESQYRKGDIILIAEEKDGIGDIKAELGIRTLSYRQAKLRLEPQSNNKPVIAGDKTWQVFKLCNSSSYPALNLNLSLTRIDVVSTFSELEQKTIRVIPAKQCREIVAHFKPQISLKSGYRMRTALVVNDSQKEIAHLRLGTRVNYDAMGDVKFEQRD
ncbi:hypothetical protein [Vibrio breoganii]|uniref:hypothetical protein n=1 Tax=Vibrio breoganii TaxID=553239 RepID=UPI000C859BBC|nr:hypothetical protein [Vibrio breoganii]PMK26293.1 hypothetical protein BCU03_19075 [Vibrio breoganii]